MHGGHRGTAPAAWNDEVRAVQDVDSLAAENLRRERPVLQSMMRWREESACTQTCASLRRAVLSAPRFAVLEDLKPVFVVSGRRDEGIDEPRHVLRDAAAPVGPQAGVDRDMHGAEDSTARGRDVAAPAPRRTYELRETPSERGYPRR